MCKAVCTLVVPFVSVSPLLLGRPCGGGEMIFYLGRYKTRDTYTCTRRLQHHYQHSALFAVLSVRFRKFTLSTTVRV